MLRSSEMAAREDLHVGILRVSPSRRLLFGPAGKVTLEPRVMQVLVCLIEATGAVVTRETLLQQCWGGVPVGEDSINGAVAKLRRAMDKVFPGGTEIETIPRTGYRLTALGEAKDDRRAGKAGLDRRAVMTAGIFALAGMTGYGLLGPENATFAVEDAIRDADRALRDQYPGNGEEAHALLTRATDREPDNGKAWGLLALAYRELAESGARDQASDSVKAGLAAADRALSIDPRQSDALTARATLRPEFGNWLQVESALRHVIEIDPENFHATSYLTMLLQGVGRARESWDFNERAIEIDPLSPVPQYRRGLKQWIFGQDEAAYLAIDRAYQTWPDHSAVWSARLNIYAFTGRSADLPTMLGDGKSLPKGVGKPAVDYFRSLGRAVTTRAPADVERLRQLSTRFSPQSPYFSTVGIMGLSYLTLLDDAFRVAEGVYLLRGPLASSLWSEPGNPKIADSYWRRTMNLFTPAVRPMRLDPRFSALSESMGLERYWQDSGTRPDGFLMR